MGFKASVQELSAGDIEILKLGYSDRQKAVPDRIIFMLEQLADLSDEIRGVNQLHHSLMIATMAVRAGATDEIVLAALCHDIGKYVGQHNHAAVGAEILKPYVSHETYMIVKTHDVFQGLHVNHHLGKDPYLRNQYRSEPWFAAAEQFVDEWDTRAFDRNYPVKPLDEFRPLIQKFFLHPSAK